MQTKTWLDENQSNIDSHIRSRGFELLHFTPLRKSAILVLRCPNGHSQELPADRAFGPRWPGRCRPCEQIARRDRLHELALHRGGRVIGSVPLRLTDRVELECSKDHRWSARLDSVLRNNYWCRKCRDNDKRISLADAKALATRSGGTVTSTTCAGSKDPLTWQCACGQQWQTTYAIQRRKPYFCKSCRIPTGRKKPTATSTTETKHRQLSRAQDIARQHGGRCLSTSYRNLNDTLSFECAKGHRFVLVARSALHYGSWCRRCYRDDHPRRTSITVLRDFAAAHEGVLVSEEYVNAAKNLIWRCRNGHLFRRSWNNMQRYGRHFCPECPRS